MKLTMNIEQHQVMKKKIENKLNTRTKSKFNENDDMSILIKKKEEKCSKNKGSEFRNNYKNYQYDYEEDFYEPR